MIAALAGDIEQADITELAVDDPGGLDAAWAIRVQAGRDVGDRGAGLSRLGSRPIELQLHERIFARGGGPPDDILTATLGMPKNIISLCFQRAIDLRYGEGGVGARGQTPSRLVGRRRAIQRGWQTGQELVADDGNKGEGAYIGEKPPDNGGAFVGEAVERRMDFDRL